MTRPNKRAILPDASFTCARDAKKARLHTLPLPDRLSVAPQPPLSPVTRLQDLPGELSDENYSEKEEETELDPIVQIEGLIRGLSSCYYGMIIEELDGYTAAQSTNKAMAAGILEHCANLAYTGLSDLRYEKYVASKASEACWPEEGSEPEMSPSEDEDDDALLEEKQVGESGAPGDEEDSANHASSDNLPPVDLGQSLEVHLLSSSQPTQSVMPNPIPQPTGINFGFAAYCAGLERPANFVSAKRKGRSLGGTGDRKFGSRQARCKPV
ncbi:hypothetical protein BDZ89DRAFT_1071699 [Hymenopellis radicata]|nr:hypothetical protein BDZ89DRAFT_1071699 [Hymenopellis radicata]